MTPRDAQAAHEEQAGAELARVAAAQGESVDKLQARLAARQAEKLKGGKVGLTFSSHRGCVLCQRRHHLLLY